jgi:hypothetical protein
MMSHAKEILLMTLLLAGCRPADMYDQNKSRYYAPHSFFPDRRAARMPVEHSVFRDTAGSPPWRDAHLDPTRNTPPFPVTRDDLNRGQERYDIYCTPCHGWTGEGNGMIVQRGYLQPPSFHDPMLKGKTVAHYVQVMTTGYGAMPSYASQINPRDRWLIAVYLRVLQFSRDIPAASLPDETRSKLEEGTP